MEEAARAVDAAGRLCGDLEAAALGEDWESEESGGGGREEHVDALEDRSVQEWAPEPRWPL